MIYFIQAGDNGPIKIGTCKDGGFSRRFASLQTAAPNGFDILGVMDGDAETEGQLHARFRIHRRRGEWFAPEAEIAEFIAANCRPFEKPTRRQKPLSGASIWRVNLAALIEKSGKSLRAISLGAGLSPGFVHEILKNGKSPSVDNLAAVAAQLNVSVLELLA